MSTHTTRWLVFKQDGDAWRLRRVDAVSDPTCQEDAIRQVAEALGEGRFIAVAESMSFAHDARETTHFRLSPVEDLDV